MTTKTFNKNPANITSVAVGLADMTRTPATMTNAPTAPNGSNSLIPAAWNGATTNSMMSNKTVRTLSRRSLYSFCKSSNRNLPIVVIVCVRLRMCQSGVPAIQRRAALTHQILQALACQADRADLAVVDLAGRDLLQPFFKNVIELQIGRASCRERV